MTHQEISEAYGDAVASWVEHRMTHHHQSASIVMQQSATGAWGWNVMRDGVPLFAAPTDHRFALSIADAINR